MELLKSIIISVALGTLFLSVTVSGNACGGSLSGDGGEFELTPHPSSDSDLECVWVIKLLSRQSLVFTLDKLESSSATVSLFPEHDASETVLNPIRLTNANVGETVQTAGQSLVVVLTRTDSGLSFSWDSASTGSSDTLTETNYIDTYSGRVLWNRFYSPERLTWVLNLESAQMVTFNSEIEFETCEALNPCECSYFGLYEVLSTGYLREVTRVCGRSLSFKADELPPKLVAFVYINSTSVVRKTNQVEISWSADSKGISPTAATETEQPSTEPGTTGVTPDPSIINLECGGVVIVPKEGDSITIAYKYGEIYEDNENCLWSLDLLSGYGVNTFAKLNVTLVAEGFDDNHDGVAVVTRLTDTMSTNILELGKMASYTGHHHFITFTSDPSGTGSGFILEIRTTAIQSDSQVFDRKFYSGVPGVAIHGPFAGLERSAIGIQPLGQLVSFGLEYYHLSSNSNCAGSMHFYEVGTLGKLTRMASVCGNKDSPMLLFSTHRPVLAIFTAYTFDFYISFEISWNSTSPLAN